MHRRNLLAVAVFALVPGWVACAGERADEPDRTEDAGMAAGERVRAVVYKDPL